MDELSNLLKEAKPLYKRRKQRRTIAKACLIFCIPMIFMGTLANFYIQGSDVYLAMENNKLQSELLQDDFGLRP